MNEGRESLLASERSTIWLAIEAGVYGPGRDKRPEAYAALERLMESCEELRERLTEAQRGWSAAEWTIRQMRERPDLDSMRQLAADHVSAMAKP